MRVGKWAFGEEEYDFTTFTHVFILFLRFVYLSAACNFIFYILYLSFSVFSSVVAAASLRLDAFFFPSRRASSLIIHIYLSSYLKFLDQHVSDRFLLCS